ncbi:hypothetical protein [Bradyrhizobium sp. USDA 3256]
MDPPSTWWPESLDCAKMKQLTRLIYSKHIERMPDYRRGRAEAGQMTDERRGTVTAEYSPAFVILVDGYIAQGNLAALQSLRAIYTAATRRPLVSNRQDNLNLMSIFETRLVLLDEAITTISLAALKQRLSQEQPL